MGFGRMAGIFLVCMRDSSANRCGEEYHLEIKKLRAHGGSGDACTRSLGIRTLFSVYLTVRLSIYRS